MVLKVFPLTALNVCNRPKFNLETLLEESQDCFCCMADQGTEAEGDHVDVTISKSNRKSGIRLTSPGPCYTP